MVYIRREAVDGAVLVVVAAAVAAAAGGNSPEDPLRRVDVHTIVEAADIGLCSAAQEALDFPSGHSPVERQDQPDPAGNHRRADDLVDDWDSWVEKSLMC